MFRSAQDSTPFTPKQVFSKGLIDNLQNEEIPDANSCYLRNCRIDGFGTKVRNGYVQKATCPTYPCEHLGHWNMKDTSGNNKNLLVYAQDNSISGIDGQAGFYDIDANSCITALTPTKVYWLGPMTTVFNTTPVQAIGFRAELGSFAPVAIRDTANNLVQQFDPSACTSLDEFTTFIVNYPNETIADWHLVTNGIVHVDYGDGLVRDMVLDFTGLAGMADVYLLFGTVFDALPKYQTLTTGYIKVNGSDIGPINLSAVTTVEGIALAINAAFGSPLCYVRYSVNTSGERAPFIFFDYSTLTSIDRSSTGQGLLLWSLLGGDQLPTTSQFVASRLQTVRMGQYSRIYGAHSASSYYLYSAYSTQAGFLVIDNDYHQRLCLKPNGVKPTLGAIFDSFHFISGDVKNSSVMYQSVRAFYEDFESPGSDAYTFDGPITAMLTNNHEMFVFTKTSIGLLQAGGFTPQGGIYRYNIQQLETQEGALSQAGCVAVGSKTYFWTPSNKIKMVGRNSFGSYDVADLSHRQGNGIDYTMKYAINTDQSKMFGVYVPQDNIIKWFCRSINGTDIDMAIVYDLNKDTWLVDTYAVTKFAHGTHDGNKTFLTGKPVAAGPSDAHKIYQDTTGKNDDFGIIPITLQTKRWNFGTPTQEKQFWGARLFLDMEVNAIITCQIYVNGTKVYEKDIKWSDGSKTAGNRPLDPNVWEVAFPISKGNLRKKGKNIQFRFTNPNAIDESQYTFKDLMIEVLGLPLETSNTNISKY